MGGIWRLVVPVAACVAVGYGSVFARAYWPELTGTARADGTSPPNGKDEEGGPTTVPAGDPPAGELAKSLREVDAVKTEWERAYAACEQSMRGIERAAKPAFDAAKSKLESVTNRAELNAARDELTKALDEPEAKAEKEIDTLGVTANTLVGRLDAAEKSVPELDRGEFPPAAEPVRERLRARPSNPISSYKLLIAQPYRTGLKKLAVRAIKPAQDEFNKAVAAAKGAIQTERDRAVAAVDQTRGRWRSTKPPAVGDPDYFEQVGKVTKDLGELKTLADDRMKKVADAADLEGAAGKVRAALKAHRAEATAREFDSWGADIEKAVKEAEAAVEADIEKAVKEVTAAAAAAQAAITDGFAEAEKQAKGFGGIGRTLVVFVDSPELRAEAAALRPKLDALRSKLGDRAGPDSVLVVTAKGETVAWKAGAELALPEVDPSEHPYTSMYLGFVRANVTIGMATEKTAGSRPDVVVVWLRGKVPELDESVPADERLKFTAGGPLGQVPVLWGGAADGKENGKVEEKDNALTTAFGGKPKVTTTTRADLIKDLEAALNRTK